MALPKSQPVGASPTTRDFVTMQSTWASILDPIVAQVNAGDGVPVGSYTGFNATLPTVAQAAKMLPTKFLFTQGQLVLRNQYPQLFAIIGTVYNTGGESAQYFRLPTIANTIIKYLP
jgi:hypothetical protein